MPANQLDPRSALVVVDLQKGLSAFSFTRPFAEVVHNAARLAESFRRAGLPVVLVRVIPPRPGEGWRQQRVSQTLSIASSPEFGELMPALGPRPDDVVVTKRHWDAFYGTDLDMQLRRRGVTGIVLAGVRTCIGVEGTARAAAERAYNLTFVEDAIADFDGEAHEHSVNRIFPRLGEVDTTARVLALLTRTT
jgi:nicotinamidase-related amidase